MRKVYYTTPAMEIKLKIKRNVNFEIIEKFDKLVR
jgi:hypothetical protein